MRRPQDLPINELDQYRLIDAFDEHANRLFVKPEDKMGKLVHASMGIAGESGELIDAVKKAWIYGKELDEENILEECGDALFYISVMLTQCNFTLGGCDASQHRKVETPLPRRLHRSSRS